MPYRFTPPQITAFEALISAPRFGTYLREASGDRNLALRLYCWNADLSAAFYPLLQFAEVAVRNGAVEAIEKEFGANWHHNRGFKYSLPMKRGRYRPRDDLQSCAERLPTAGKVVAELKFVFWQYLFIAGQDRRLWNKHFFTAFPGADHTGSVADAREDLHNDIQAIRIFRNRIAHHEPIYGRDLPEEQRLIRKTIHSRRPEAAAWIDGFERITTLLAQRPV